MRLPYERSFSGCGENWDSGDRTHDTTINSRVLLPSELYPKTGTVGLEPTPSPREKVFFPLNYVPMQSGSGLYGCRHRTDATCKTVANKGISFVYAVLGPCTPPQSYKQSLSARLSLRLQNPRLTPPRSHSHKPPTIYSESLGTSNSLCLTSDVRCFRSPPPLRFLRPTKHDGSVGYGSRTSVIRSFSEVSTAA